uniref:Glutathione S-transferase n=1 Tax=Plectus sambesii TaxID=2011161 RepID=A0A914V7T6_9BILA
MPSYTLYNFNTRGRIEFVRYMLLHADVPFDDFRIDSQLVPGQWDEYKPKMPMGQLPVLEVDGKDMIPQSLAIGRFVAKKTKNYGSNDLEAAHIDAFIESAADILPKLYPTIRAIFTSNDDLKNEEWTKIREDITKHLNLFETTLQKNGSGWLVGNKLSAADFYIGELVDRLEGHIDSTILNDFPHLKKLKSAIANLPRVKDYIATRAKSIW